MLAAFQFRTCAVYSTRRSKVRSPKYKNNNFTCYPYDDKTGHILKEKTIYQVSLRRECGGNKEKNNQCMEKTA